MCTASGHGALVVADRFGDWPPVSHLKDRAHEVLSITDGDPGSHACVNLTARTIAPTKLRWRCEAAHTAQPIINDISAKRVMDRR